MNENRVGKIGSVNVRLIPWNPERQRYERKYVPVTPASREIEGADAKVAADSTVAEWQIDDWSAGEGDLRWQNRDRYNESEGMGPASDGSGVIANFHVEQLYDLGGATVMEDSTVLARGWDTLLTGDDTVGDLYTFDLSTGEWDAIGTGQLIGGSGADDVGSIAVVNSSPYIASTANDEISRYGQAPAYNPWHSSFTDTPWLINYGDVLYAVVAGNLHTIDLSTSDTDTEIVDTEGTVREITDLGASIVTVSDVGPIWLVPYDDGRTQIWEYNVADDTGSVVGELPGDVTVYGLWFHNGIYYVGYRATADGSYPGDAFIYYQSGGQRGSVGPVRSLTGTTASKPVKIAGVIGDRLYFYYDTAFWAYDLSSGSISIIARDVTEPSSTLVYGNAIFVATSGVPSLSYRIVPGVFGTDTGAELTTGRFDFGYLGLAKTLTKVTVACESPLATGETVGLEYAADGGVFTAASGTIVAGESTKTWIISTNAATVRGVDFELKLSVKAATSSSSPKIVSVTSEAVGAESRLEWILLVDASDNNEQHAATVIDGLKALKTAHDVVEFTDPWQVLPTVAAETFDVTVEEVNLPDLMPGGEPFAVIRLRGVETV